MTLTEAKPGQRVVYIPNGCAGTIDYIDKLDRVIVIRWDRPSKEPHEQKLRAYPQNVRPE